MQKCSMLIIMRLRCLYFKSAAAVLPHNECESRYTTRYVPVAPVSQTESCCVLPVQHVEVSRPRRTVGFRCECAEE